MEAGLCRVCVRTREQTVRDGRTGSGTEGSP